MARWLVLAFVGLATAIALPARAQQCADTPPDWRPQVRASLRGPSRVAPGESVELYASLWPVFCHYGDGPPPVGRGQLTALLDGAPTEVRVWRGRVRLRAPSAAGPHRLELRSVQRPELVPAGVDFVVVDPSAAHTTELTLELPRNRVPSRASLRVEAVDGSWRRWPCRRARRELRCAIEEPHGIYRVETLRRAVREVALEGSPQRVRFGGSHVRVLLDGLPVTGSMYRLEVECADGARLVEALGSHGADLGDDVPPGTATVRVQAVPRVNPWNPGDPELRWRTLRELTLEVPDASELIVRWSSPSLFSNADPSARAWTAVGGTGTRAASPPPTGDRAFAMVDGVIVAIGDGLWERSDGWRRWTAHAALARGAWLTPSGPHIGVNDTRRVAALDATRYAWIEGGQSVFLRTPNGLAQEWPPLYSRDDPYPCYTTGVAIADGELVIVGRCRGHAPEWSTGTPHGGFVAVRGPERWEVRRFDGPLRAIAADGATLVAVGDGGRVVRRERGSWSESRLGRADFAEVQLTGARVIARTPESIVEIGASGPRELHRRHEHRRLHPPARFCVAGAHVVTWHRYGWLPDEGSAPDHLPDLITVDGRIVFRSEGPTLVGIACQGDHAYAWRRDAGAPVRLELAPR